MREGFDLLTTAQFCADGMSSAEFDSGTYKTNDPDAGRFPDRVIVVAPGADQSALDAAVYRGRTIGQAAIDFILQEPTVASVLPNIYDMAGLEEFTSYDRARRLPRREARRAQPAGAQRAIVHPIAHKPPWGRTCSISCNQPPPRR